MFSPRERQLLIHITSGNGGVRDFAVRKNISPKTAEMYYYNLSKKIGTSNRALMTHWAISKGIIKLINFSEIGRR